jgi:hypothetical protein
MPSGADSYSTWGGLPGLSGWACGPPIAMKPVQALWRAGFSRRGDLSPPAAAASNVAWVFDRARVLQNPLPGERKLAKRGALSPRLDFGLFVGQDGILRADCQSAPASYARRAASKGGCGQGWPPSKAGSYSSSDRPQPVAPLKPALQSFEKNPCPGAPIRGICMSGFGVYPSLWPVSPCRQRRRSTN